MRQFGRFGPLVGSIDESTSSARFMVFAANTSEMLTYHQIPIKTYHPKEGWVEQDPLEIWNAVLECIEVSVDNLRKLDINPDDIVTVGITNQRETTILWNYKTGIPVYNALLWMDTRAEQVLEEVVKQGSACEQWVTWTSGLPVSSYFSAPKLSWLLRQRPDTPHGSDECMAGTIDSWLIWNLTGGCNGGLHMTDVTNASRTMLMNIETLQWEPHLCAIFGVPERLLPCIRSSSEIYGYIVTGSLTGTPISGCLGDQQAALLGQNCSEFGQAECTFGAGTFLLYNTGTSIIRSKNGLLTTVAYKLGPNAPTMYALEGSVANAGAALEWLHSGLGLTQEGAFGGGEPQELGDAEGHLRLPPPGRGNGGGRSAMARLGSSEIPEDTSQVYFVPAFSGLYAPYWRRDAGSIMCGLSSSTGPSDVLNGALRSCGLQTLALLRSLQEDLGLPAPQTLLGGGALGAQALMQAQADCTGIPIVRPHQVECWALGAAMAAASAYGVNVWPQNAPPSPSDTFYPTTTEDEREMMYVKWQMAIERSFGWTSKTQPLHEDKDDCDIRVRRVYSSIPAGIFLVTSCIFLLLASKLKT